MATSLIRSRATITGVKDRFVWNEIKDGAVLQEDGFLVIFFGAAGIRMLFSAAPLFAWG